MISPFGAMADDDGGRDRQVFQDLRADIGALSAKVDRLAARFEDVAVGAERTETNRSEIRALRRDLRGTDGVISRLSKLENGNGAHDGLTLSWKFLIALVTGAATVAAAIVYAVAEIITGG